MPHTSLVQEFDSLVQVVTAATNEKIAALLKMNNLVSSFDESWETASIESHISMDEAAEVIYQAGDDYGCETYIKDLHPKLMSAISQEKTALAELRTFITTLNISATDGIGTPLAALAIKAGKIVTDTIATA